MSLERGRGARSAKKKVFGVDRPRSWDEFHMCINPGVKKIAQRTQINIDLKPWQDSKICNYNKAIVGVGDKIRVCLGLETQSLSMATELLVPPWTIW